jgi:nucleotide-binding universal stress UspA family protein
MALTSNVLAAVGLFPQDDAVLARAAEIAVAHRAALTVVHVIDFRGGCDFAPADMELIGHQTRLIAREKVEAAIARLTPPISRIDIRIETGSPALRLIELSQEIGADLILMRAHQRHSIAEKVIGSISDRVIRCGPIPVLVVKRLVTRAYQRVVVATDKSTESDAASAFVAALLPATALHLVHVAQIPPQFEEAMLRVGGNQTSLAAHRDVLIRTARAHLRDASARLTGRPMRTTTRVLVGDPAATLLRATRSPKVDLIALGPGSPSLIRRALIGSVARRVLRDAACDVLICRTQAGQE